MLAMRRVLSAEQAEKLMQMKHHRFGEGRRHGGRWHGRGGHEGRGDRGGPGGGTTDGDAGPPDPDEDAESFS
jgi:hypothetical protein